MKVFVVHNLDAGCVEAVYQAKSREAVLAALGDWNPADYTIEEAELRRAK